ncbi:hypothetical protein [Dactylosporangium sp. NPDC051541]|uniref:hypothetical protein n=1 Tax=Dactylosporangium sp. NPDC051541 TaxID=3363977 RepID=UPI0037B1B537
MTSPLEMRYERLLRVYPAAFRRAHGDDMLTTMLADAGDGQRWPRPGDAANVVLHGLRLRLFRGRATRSGWAEACALIGPLLAFLVLAVRLAITLRGPLPAAASTTVIVRDAIWAAVAVAAFAGLRRVAAAIAWAALLAEILPLADNFGTDPVMTVYSLWWPALALVTAATLTAAGPGGPWRVAGRRRTATILAAITVLCALPVIGFSGWFGPRFDDVDYRGSTHLFYPAEFLLLHGPGSSEPLYITSSAAALNLLLLGTLVALIVLVVAAVRLPGPVRRRLLVAVAPVLTLVVLLDLGFNGWALSNYDDAHDSPLAPGQWAVLVLLPLTVFLLGAWWVRRRDETMRLAELGARLERDA